MKVTDENIERYKKAIISRDAKLKQMTQWKAVENEVKKETKFKI